MTLTFLGNLDQFGVFASLGETVFFVVGTAVFVFGQLRTGKLASSAKAIAPSR
jgi:hypothetical protein